MKRKLIMAGTLVFFLAVSGALFAQNRYALIIGNNNYQNEVLPLTNPANDAEDIAKAVKELGYDVVLKTDVTLTDMMKLIEQFTASLRRNAESEGFFWFAGHGLSIKEKHYLLPIDVNPSSENMIERTSYAVDELMAEIERTENKDNVIVLDACRNKVLPASSSASRSVGNRGLSIVSQSQIKSTGCKVVYSTGAGMTAADGAAGSRNSPFAEAFLKHIKSPDTFDNILVDIREDTKRLTALQQTPYATGTFATKSYSLNSAGRQQVSVAQVSATAQASQQALQVGAVSVAQGSLNINTSEAGQLTIVINGIPYDFGTLPGYASLPIANVNAGEHQAIMRYSDGYMEEITVSVVRNQIADVDFQYKIRSTPVPNAPAPVPNAPAPVPVPSSVYNDEDDWKNKWVYLGFLGGYGGYTWEEEDYGSYYSYQNSYSVSLGIVGGIVQLQLLKYFALEADLGVAFGGGDTYPLAAVGSVLTFRPSTFEIDVGAGYVIGFGPEFTLGLGLKLGTGVLFAEYMGIFGGEKISYAFVNTFIAGYKFGLGSK
jgi:hypothetical protein